MNQFKQPALHNEKGIARIDTSESTQLFLHKNITFEKTLNKRPNAISYLDRTFSVNISC